MKKLQIALIVIFVFLLVFVSFSISQSQDIKKLKAGMPNTVTLSNGEVIYDLNGEWDALYDNKGYGGINKDIVKITQKGNEFVGIKLIGNQWMPKGSETVKGVLEKDGFKSLNTNSYSDGWTPATGKTGEKCNKIVIETPLLAAGVTLVITLTRK
jgi:hypothetical protein